jgi:amino acid adenylation domain-containing protein
MNPSPVLEQPNTYDQLLTELQNCPPSERSNAAKLLLRNLLVEFLELDSLDEVGERQSFAELGADSIQAVDFKVKLEKLLDCKLRSTLLFDYPSVDVLADYLVDEVLVWPTEPVQAENADAPIPVNPSLAVAEDEIAIVAIAGIFPDIADIEALWQKVLDTTPLKLTPKPEQAGFAYAALGSPKADHLPLLGLSETAYADLDRQEQWLLQVLGDVLANYQINPKSLSERVTGVFVGVREAGHDAVLAYRVPLAHRLSFQLNLKGPSEVVNSFCTSVYQALHQAAQSLKAGECEQAIIGAINLIEANDFAEAAKAGLYDAILSKNNQTHSFCEQAEGYVRSEGVGVLLIKPLSLALQDGNKILALVKSTASYHGGRGYSYEAPNPQGLKEVFRLGLNKAGISSDNIDYIEAHGIGNKMADALELGAINQVYKKHSANPDKRWHISCIKPSLGHPEMASGIATLAKVLKAFEHNVLPGIAGLDQPNTELAPYHALILSEQNQPWPRGDQPRRAALTGFAIGGITAQVILEEYRTDENADLGIDAVDLSLSRTPFDKLRTNGAGLSQQRQCEGADLKPAPSPAPTNQKIAPDLSPAEDAVLAALFWDVFSLNLASIDQSLSLVEFGFDSMKVMTFVALLNERLGLALKFSQVLGIDKIAELHELLADAQALKQAGEANKAQAETPVLLAQKLALSEVQKGLWYIHETAADPIGFNVPIAFKLDGEVNTDALRSALSAMLERHPILTAMFVTEQGSDDIVQVLRPSAECLQFERLALPESQTAEQAMTALARKPFNLKQDPLVRLYLLENSASSSWVLFVIHHLVFDGISGALFIQEFWTAYNTCLSGQSLPKQAAELAFFDYVAWEQDYLAGAEAAEDLAWWRSKLGAQTPTLNLPYDRLPQANTLPLDIGCCKRLVPDNLFADLKRHSLELKVNLSALLLTAFQIFLYKMTRETALAVTTPVRGRPKTVHENSIGCYINVIVTSTHLSPNQTFAELALANRQHFIESLDHAKIPFPRLLAELGLTLTNPKEVPFPVSFTYQNFFDSILESEQALQGVNPIYDIYQQTDDHYTLEVYDFRQSLQLNFKYKRSLFDDDTLARHMDYFTVLLAEICKDAGRKVKDYPILPPEQYQLIVHDFNQSRVAVPESALNLDIGTLFLAVCNQHPKRVALVCGGESLTYAELANKAQRVAAYLEQQGIQPSELVAVFMERSLDMVVAVLGILLSGAAYLPIASDQAGERLAYQLQDAKVRIILTQTHLQDRLRGLAAGPYLSQTVRNIQCLQAELPPWQSRPLDLDSLAYVIYTSGSTGQPKGVMISRRSLVNLSLAMIAEYDIGVEDRVLQFASLAFDMSVEEIFPYLLAGAGIVIRHEDDIEAERFYRVVTENKVTILNLPPQFFTVIDALLPEQKSKLFKQVGLVSFGGEALPQTTLAAMQHYPVQIFNAYGPTEATVNAAIADVTHSETSVIGKPIANMQLYVLDDDLNVLPVGVVGELYLAGVGIALGYLNQPELTAGKFLRNQFGSGRLYKTGDLARWLPDGVLQYQGRNDDQVKIRGFRVELGEIERVLLGHSNVSNAAVILQTSGKHPQLVAFVVAEGDLAPNDLRLFLREHLPEYMIPSAFQTLPQLPLTANGKIDRAALQNQTLEISDHAPYTAPENAVETTLAEIWQEVLGLEQVGIDDNFFNLGGHSLLAIQIVLRINRQLSVNLPVSALFEAGDIRHLALRIGQSERHVQGQSLGDFVVSSNEMVF